MQAFMSKKSVYTRVSRVGPFILAVGLGCYSTLACAQTNVQVPIGTGGDDLRGGNTAFMTMVLVDGEVLPEQILSTLLNGNTNSTSLLTFPRTVDATQIRSIRIRHDGSPRSGHPFDTYDNWDLRTLRVNLAVSPFGPIVPLYNSARDSRVSGLVARFTGDLQQIDLPIRAIGTEPDFIITRIGGSPSGLSVNLSNIGLGRGRVTDVSCSALGRAITRATSIVLNPGATASVPVRFVPRRGRVTCSPSGVDSVERPEAVTANNKFSRSF